MRIAFTGASSTGKSSVAKSFVESDANRSLGYSVIGVNSRSLLSSLGLASVSDMPSSVYRVFQTMYLSQKLLVEGSADRYLTERSFADCLAYWRVHCSETATPSENELIESICKANTSRYDKHFLFPTGAISLVDDGFRNTREDYHREFERVLIDILEDCNVETVRMPRASVMERVAFFVGHLND